MSLQAADDDSTPADFTTVRDLNMATLWRGNATSNQHFIAITLDLKNNLSEADRSKCDNIANDN